MTAPSDADRVLWRIRIDPLRPDLDAQGAAVLRSIHELGLTGVTRAAFSRLYLLEGPLAEAQVRRIAEELLTDPITERFSLLRGGDDRDLPGEGFDACIEVHLKGGVMDPVAASALAAVADMGLAAQRLVISTARLYRLAGLQSAAQAETVARRLLCNDCIETAYISGFGRHDARPKRLPAAPQRDLSLRHVALRELDEAALVKLSREAHLFLSAEEMIAIRDHYRRQGREPTDLELETFAQTWSEHCVHKTLRSAVSYIGDPMPLGSPATGVPAGAGAVRIEYANLLADTIARATRTLQEQGRAEGCLSVFKDNAGVIAFDDEYGLAFKVETHNRPSAIEPYGGAATGIGGVIRDVMGCGLGARPIANTDVFCVASPDFPAERLPRGVMHPRRVLQGVVAGVRDYGNRMGIPTVNGAVLFDDRYLGNPLVFCGCLGLIPRGCIAKEPRPGDLVVVMGGRTGLDGIHGATFSSAELTDGHADEFAHAVQIGNAITEKQVLDAMLQARDHPDGCLYTAVTDCGAGGLSSAVGEMAGTLGAVVDLDKVPLKYAGLRYDEIWISEAQERMVLAVPPDRWEALQAICRAENVEATAIGVFGNAGRLHLRYRGQTVGDLDADFLHHGLPSRRRQAEWRASEPGACTGAAVQAAPPAKAADAADFGAALLERLSAPDTAGKEWIIRQYDHEVQGTSVIKPLTGPGQGPSDAAVIRPRLDGRGGVALGCGLCPRMSDADPYWMAVAAIDEALRNVVCVGGDLSRTAILDNFCWGNCDDPRELGALVRACQGCHDAAVAYGVPFISGKDSLNNAFALDPADAAALAGRLPIRNGRIVIPGTLLISAVSVIEDIRRCVTMDAKPGDGAFVLVRMSAADWAGIGSGGAVRLHRAVAGWIAAGLVQAAHDCGGDGVLVTLAEMALAGRCGMDVTCDPAEGLVEVPCGYVLQVTADAVGRMEREAGSLTGVAFTSLGRTRPDERFVVRAPDGSGGFSLNVADLDRAWRSGPAW